MNCMKRTIANELPPVPCGATLKPINQAPAQLLRSNGRYAILKEPYSNENDIPHMDVVDLQDYSVSTVRLRANNCGIYYQKDRLYYLNEFEKATYYTPPSHTNAFSLPDAEDDVMTLLSEIHQVSDDFDIKGITLPIRDVENEDYGQDVADLLMSHVRPSMLTYHITPRHRNNPLNRTLEIRYSVVTRYYSMRHLVDGCDPVALDIKLYADTSPTVVRNFIDIALGDFVEAVRNDAGNPPAAAVREELDEVGV